VVGRLDDLTGGRDLIVDNFGKGTAEAYEITMSVSVKYG